MLHPAVIEIAFPARKRLDKRPQRLPGRRAEALGAFSAAGNPGLAHPQVTRVENRILIPRHQILVNGLPYCRDFDFHNANVYKKRQNRKYGLALFQQIKLDYSASYL